MNAARGRGAHQRLLDALHGAWVVYTTVLDAGGGDGAGVREEKRVAAATQSILALKKA
jgi:hypothetical protein